MFLSEVIKQAFFSFFATMGFSVFFNTPKKALLDASTIGAIGWVCYMVVERFSHEMIFSNFLAACMVGLCGEMLARKRKAPAILYTMPGILPLIPGGGLYLTMKYLIDRNYELSLSTGLNTILVAGAISLGAVLVTSIFRTININKYKKAITKNNMPE